MSFYCSYYSWYWYIGFYLYGHFLWLCKLYINKVIIITMRRHVQEVKRQTATRLCCNLSWRVSGSLRTENIDHHPAPDLHPVFIRQDSMLRVTSYITTLAASRFWLPVTWSGVIQTKQKTASGLSRSELAALMLLQLIWAQGPLEEGPLVLALHRLTCGAETTRPAEMQRSASVK